MNMLWDEGPLFVKEIIDRLDDPKPHFNTISTFVRILEQKGYVDHDKIGNSHRYRAAVTRHQYASGALDHLIRTYFNGSVKELIEAVVMRNELTDDDIWDLMTRLRQSRNK